MKIPLLHNVAALAALALLLQAYGSGSLNGSTDADSYSSGASDSDSPDSVSTPTPPTILGSITKVTPGAFPNSLGNAPERYAFPHYLGTNRIASNPPKLPIGSYFASCTTNTANPRMFVSLTLDNSASLYKAKTVGSVYETVYNPISGALERTGNEAVIEMCNATHGPAKPLVTSIGITIV